MYLQLALCIFSTLIGYAYNDFVVGMFQPHDYLVAQDMYYKERLPFRSVTGQYGRKFRCPITYFRVIDRLGVGRGPGIRIVRGGLRKPYIVVRFTSAYNMPLSLNIYTGCQNKLEQPTDPPPTNATTVGGGNSTKADGPPPAGGATTVAGGEDAAATTVEPV